MYEMTKIMVWRNKSSIIITDLKQKKYVLLIMENLDIS